MVGRLFRNLLLQFTWEKTVTSTKTVMEVLQGKRWVGGIGEVVFTGLPPQCVENEGELN